MAKLVKLSLEGQINSGYQVELVEIKEEGQYGRTLAEGISGGLPPADLVYQDYEEWQRQYECLDPTVRAPQKRGKGKLPREISVEACQMAAQRLKESFNQWLDYPEFQKIENILRTILSPWEDIRFLVKTKDYDLWQLPWSVWNFFDDYRNAEVAFSPAEFKGVEKPVVARRRKKVRILAVGGESTGIDYQPDQEMLKRLVKVGAAPEFLNQPTPRQVRDRLWEKQWDILFFAGHGDSAEEPQTGMVYLNSADILSPEDLENTLKHAIEKGLKIAIFNSCNGLGLARQLVTEYQIPLVIAMREEVPNRVAQDFLEHFLVQYAERGENLSVAVRKARERILDDWKERLPSIDWLPVICQNPALRPPTWQDLHRPISPPQVAVASLASTTLVMLLRAMGLLQPLEISSFDQMMLQRPPEEPDPRILVVAVTNRDLEKEEDREYMSDKTTEKLLRKLAAYQPQVIGLDIIRDSPRPMGNEQAHQKLLKYLQENEDIISVCVARPQEKPETQGYGPPPGVPVKRVGFGDFPISKNGDETIRRQLIAQSLENVDPNDPCQSKFSLSFLLAYHYLEAKGFEIKRTADQEMQFVHNKQEYPSVTMKRWKPGNGGDQKMLADGYQILLNYRSSGEDGWNVARMVTVQEVINGQIKPEEIKGKIILIGYTAKSSNNIDYHSTIYPEKMPGVLIHAHAVSQILSGIMDGRPFLWAFPWWGDALWVSSWAAVGGFFVWRMRRTALMLVAAAGAIVPISGLCFLILWQTARWMPFIPAAFAILLTTAGCAIVYIIYPLLRRQ